MREDLHKIISGDETVIAISTPLGRSGVGVVRMSGRDAIGIAQRFFKSHSSNSHLEHRTAVIGTWTNEDAEQQVDEVVVTLFRAPQSYTGEDVVEISGHGHPLGEALENLEETFGYGRLLVEGFRLAILGKPNVGKSSLFNRLVAAERAIVTDIPGTTRDVLTETVSMDGIPLRFADTAGVRDTSDQVESIGVKRTLETLSEADLALVVLDGSGALDGDDRQVLAKVEHLPHLLLINKSDLPQAIDQ